MVSKRSTCGFICDELKPGETGDWKVNKKESSGKKDENMDEGSDERKEMSVRETVRSRSSFG